MLSRDFRPVPKPTRAPKGKSVLKRKRSLKKTFNVVPESVKIEALEKSAFCFAGLCPVCGGQQVTIDDDPHHYPRRSQGGKNIVEHIWICKRMCHRHIHDNPNVEKEMFRQIEKAGHKVVWRIRC